MDWVGFVLFLKEVQSPRIGVVLTTPLEMEWRNSQAAAGHFRPQEEFLWIIIIIFKKGNCKIYLEGGAGKPGRICTRISLRQTSLRKLSRSPVLEGFTYLFIYCPKEKLKEQVPRIG